MLRFKKIAFVVSVLLGFLIPNNLYATHLIGGNLGYELISSTSDSATYRVNFSTYIDCTSPGWGSTFPEFLLDVGVYEGSINSPVAMPLVAEFSMLIDDSARIDPTLPPNCSIGTQTCIYIVNYTSVITLPVSQVGFHLIYERCCRPSGIINLAGSGNQAMTFQAFIPPNDPSTPQGIQNSAPVFTDTLVAYICVTDTTTIINSAFDNDGDSLVYSIEKPYWGYTTPNNPALVPSHPILNPYSYPPPLVNWASTVSNADPFGPGGLVTVDPLSGITQFVAPQIGIYVIAVEIKEFRNGQLIGRTRRDIQLHSVACPSNPAPQVQVVPSSPNATGPSTISIEEGESTCVPFDIDDLNNNFITVSASGPIFNSLNGQVQFSGMIGLPPLTATLCVQAQCGQANQTPHFLNIISKDDGCPPKTSVTDLSVFITPFPGPDSIIGPDTLCFESRQGVQYEVNNTTNMTLSWSVDGGVIVGPNTGDDIVVNWNGDTIGEVVVSSISQYGCPGDDVSKRVLIGDSLSFNMKADTSICYGDSIQIGGTATAGYQYNWSPSTGLSNPTSSNPFAAPLDTTNYQLELTNLAGCPFTENVTLNVYPRIQGEVSVSPLICEGDTVQLQAIGGASYSWSPSMFLNYDTIPNPLAFPDSTTIFTVDIFDQYDCVIERSIGVPVQQIPQFILEFDSVIFAGQSLQVLVNSSMNLLYTWTPPTGLSCTDCPNPEADPGITTEYQLTIADEFGCFQIDTTVLIEVIREFAYFIPNTFTPNGDGLNETIGITTYGIKSIKEFSIFNRWGEMVYTTDQLKHGWNGMYNGKLQPANTIYVYRAVLERFTGSDIELTGKILLVR